QAELVLGFFNQGHGFFWLDRKTNKEGMACHAPTNFGCYLSQVIGIVRVAIRFFDAPGVLVDGEVAAALYEGIRCTRAEFFETVADWVAPCRTRAEAVCTRCPQIAQVDGVEDQVIAIFPLLNLAA